MGRSWAEIESTLTLAQLTAYREYWLMHPPTHLLIAAELGYKAPVKLGAGGAISVQVLPDMEE